jgi:class 3 adenylate cyclase
MYERAFQLILEAQHYSTMGQAIGKLAKLDLQEGKLDSAEYRFRRILKIGTDQGQLGEQAEALLGLGDASNMKGRYKEAIELLNQARKIGYDIGQLNILMGAASGLYYAYKNTGQSNLALANHEEYILYRDSLERDENKRAAIQQEFRYAYNKQALADSLEFARKEALKDLEIVKRDSDLAKQRIGLFATGIGLLLLILLAISIRRGKKRSDELLHNILPAEVAAELKQKGKVGSKRIEQVTVIFTDFQQFSTMAENMSASDLVSDLNVYFSEFDNIMAKYKIEKIKTIGDAYMAAAGLPLPDEQHTFNMIQAAFDIRNFVEKVKEHKMKTGQPYFEIRIGVHTGPVVAGIVGVKKFQYDIWGDTVNIANRMESSGSVGKVNISQATYELIKDDSRFSFTSRGKIEAKGKGKMDMYFIEKNK